MAALHQTHDHTICSTWDSTQRRKGAKTQRGRCHYFDRISRISREDRLPKNSKHPSEAFFVSLRLCASALKTGFGYWGVLCLMLCTYEGRGVNVIYCRSNNSWRIIPHPSRKKNTNPKVRAVKWWAIVDSNYWPLPCQGSALTNWANSPHAFEDNGG